MEKNFLEFVNYIFSLHRYIKRSISIVIDINLCVICVWLALFLRLEKVVLFESPQIIVSIISSIILVSQFWIFGLYHTVHKFSNFSIIFTIVSALSVYSLIFFLIVGIHGINGIPKSIGLIQPMLLFFTLSASRIIIKFFFNIKENLPNNLLKKNVLIYGAGDAGRQLLFLLEHSNKYKVVGFLDDNIELKNQILFNKEIYHSSYLDKLINKKKINIIFIALPSISRKKKNEIIEKLLDKKLAIKTLPALNDLINGRISLSDIKDFTLEDLLGRDEIEPNLELLNKDINSKIIAVTGAGGSIGSELCRQILKYNPKKLILLELNEYSLFKIYEELKTYNDTKKLVPIIINIQNNKKLELIFQLFKVDTVYHAAAYKHVPLVEKNICEGIQNNVYGTLSLIKASINQKIENFVFISSDKAVRPTNIMGASKRLAEQCIQSFSAHYKNISNTNFSIVRFGNVIESSGSVIPKFKEQINRGGPVTLTHPNITRYFMTISEAAQLVIQAGAMGKKSEIFLLDMGKSIKIKDIIYKMIYLSGNTVKDNDNLNGDIEIDIIGLRPGEKLYEELLIGNNPKKTIHPKIYSTEEPFIPYNELIISLENLKNLIENNKINEIKELLTGIIESFNKTSSVVDCIYVEQNLNNKKKTYNLKKKPTFNIIKLKR